jgi:hypothetical protein
MYILRSTSDGGALSFNVNRQGEGRKKKRDNSRKILKSHGHVVIVFSHQFAIVSRCLFDFFCQVTSRVERDSTVGASRSVARSDPNPLNELFAFGDDALRDTAQRHREFCNHITSFSVGVPIMVGNS